MQDPPVGPNYNLCGSVKRCSNIHNFKTYRVFKKKTYWDRIKQRQEGNVCYKMKQGRDSHWIIDRHQVRGRDGDGVNQQTDKEANNQGKLIIIQFEEFSHL